MPSEPGEWARESGSAIAVGWAGYAEFDVRADPAPRVHAVIDGVPEAEAILTFTLSVLPLALPLFELEPLHAGAVSIGGAAVLLLGATGAGKSSIAAALEDLGHPLLCDDAAAVDREGLVWPGPPLLNPRWSGARQHVLTEYNGKAIRVPRAHETGPQPVLGCVILAPGEPGPLRLSTPGPREALTGIFGNVRAPSVLATRRRPLQLHVAAMLAAGSVVTARFDRHGDIEGIGAAIAGWGERVAATFGSSGARARE